MESYKLYLVQTVWKSVDAMEQERTVPMRTMEKIHRYVFVIISMKR